MTYVTMNISCKSLWLWFLILLFFLLFN